MAKQALAPAVRFVPRAAHLELVAGHKAPPRPGAGHYRRIVQRLVANLGKKQEDRQDAEFDVRNTRHANAIRCAMLSAMRTLGVVPRYRLLGRQADGKLVMWLEQLAAEGEEHATGQ